ncbi:lipopolysaccharide biosynthesis protein [Photobacterium atrarenae]|uniref:Oligosaccharide flippase family protein n=1 Tax=Photobacterium atrarenae TaxID=865757 RepID=A0ABY5GC18_9GAMM|nr:oligosaccharide flippase family protein [Photobacterium atrarenae]UTV26731.1 oligosaccharide flippase family protein [Photobacterium atrarenae]
MATIRTLSHRLPSVAAYAVGLVVSKLVGLVMQPLLTRWLSPASFGEYATLITLANLISLIMLVGMVDSLYRFASDPKYPTARVYRSAWSLTLLTSVLTALPFLIWPQWIAAWLPGDLSAFSVRCLVVSLALGTHSALQLAKLRIDDQALRFLRVQVIFALAQGGFMLLLTPVMGVDGLMLAGVLAQAVQWGLLHRPCPRLTLADARLLLRYGIGIAVSGGVGFIAFGAERFVLASAIGTAELAVYAIAMQWAVAATLLLDPFNLWWFPQRFRHLQSPGGKAYVARMSIFGSQCAALIGAILIALGCPFLLLWLPESYHQASDILPLLAWMMVIKYLSTQLNTGCYYQQNSDLTMVISAACAALALLLMWLVIPRFGLYGAVWAGLLVQSCRFTLFLGFSQRLLPLNYPVYPLSKQLGGLAGVTLLQWFQARAAWPVSYTSALMSLLLLWMAFSLWQNWQRSHQPDVAYD